MLKLQLGFTILSFGDNGGAALRAAAGAEPACPEGMVDERSGTILMCSILFSRIRVSNKWDL